MLRSWLAALCALTLVSAAQAGLFTTPLSTANASPLKKVAVVSVLGDTLHARQVGLSVFGNRAFDAEIPGWNIDAGVTALLRENIVASGKINGAIEPLVVTMADRKQILAQAQEGGFDAVVIAAAEQDPNNHFLAPGPGTQYKNALGIHDLRACNGMSVRIWRVADGKQIGYTHPDQCIRRLLDLAWHDQWVDYTDAEKQATLDAVQSFIHQQVLMALADLALLAK